MEALEQLEDSMLDKAYGEPSSELHDEHIERSLGR